MEKVLGVGGIFFMARDPEGLAAWYRENLGVPVEPGQTFGEFASSEAGEPTVWSVFPSEGSMNGSQSFKVNYRVRNLDAILAQLRRSGATVGEEVLEYSFGRFGWAADPEGNRFELWEPRKD